MDMIQAIHEWENHCKDWLDWQEKADVLRETKNDNLAEIITKQNGGSYAEKLRQARISQDWKDYVAGLLEAEAQARRVKFRMKRAEYIIQACQDSNATARKGMNMHGAL